MPETRHWQDISPAEAEADALNLAVHTDITAPLNEAGERCPWPWEPQQLVGVPLGQYHCRWCGAMCVAGVPHPDYRETPHGEHATLDPGCAQCAEEAGNA